jgi:hypothetical protein
MVDITGTDLTGACGVTFGGIAATTFTVHSATHATATVPTGAVTGPIVVRTPSGTATSATNFEVTTGGVEHSRSVSLSLRRHLVARGSVASDTAVCEAGVTVTIERRRAGGWHAVGSDETNPSGRFRAPLNDRPGRYRAVVAEETIGTDVCLADASPRERHRH